MWGQQDAEGDIPCQNCEDGEHAECEDPDETWSEWDTGAHHVRVCCCGPMGGDELDDRRQMEIERGDDAW